MVCQERKGYGKVGISPSEKDIAFARHKGRMENKIKQQTSRNSVWVCTTSD